MNNRNFLSSTAPLFRLKIRLLLNAFYNWSNAGRIVAAIFVMAVTSHAMAAGASDLIGYLQTIPFGEYFLEWALAFISVYLIILVFTGDLITGHSINAGQMSSDFTYLTTLPIPPLGLILVKLFERMLTDYVGLLILLTGTLGIVFRDGFTFTGLAIGLTIYFQISMLIGLSINIMMVCMQRFFRTATINNLFSVMGYLSAFLTLFPYLILSNFPVESLGWLIEYSDSFRAPALTVFQPFRWLALSLLNQGNCREFAFWSGFWAVSCLVGGLIFYWMIKQNWLTCSHSAAKRKIVSRKRIFSGFFQKELILLKSDFNMLVNAILMPVTIIILEIYFLKKVISFGAAGQILNVIYAAVIYFCMFGPINSVGAEGKSISIIESLPMSCAEFLSRKFLFWLIIAEAIFIPASLAAHKVLGFSMVTAAQSTLYITLFTGVCVWISVHISAIFPKFESKILQQKSSLTGKVAALALMLLAAPIKTFDPVSLINLLILAIALILIVKAARENLENRMDPDFSTLSPATVQPYILLLITFVGADIAMKQFFLAVIPGLETGLSSWLVACIVFFSATFFFNAHNLTGKNGKKLRQELFTYPDLLSIASGIILTILFCAGIYVCINHFPEKFILLASDIKSLYLTEIVSPGHNIFHTEGPRQMFEGVAMLFQSNFWFSISLLLILVCSLTFETAFRGVLQKSPNQKVSFGLYSIFLSILATAAIAPAGLAAIFAISGLVAVIIQRKLNYLPSTWLFSATTATTIFLSLLFL